MTQKLVSDNPKLKEKPLSDGNLALYLDYYLGRSMVYDKAKDKMVSKASRKREFLKLTIIAKPRTPMERQMNKQTLQLAEKIRFERQQELLQHQRGYSLNSENRANLLDFFEKYLANYTKKDKRMIGLAVSRFKDFLRDTPEYNTIKDFIKPKQLSRDMVEDFTDYLKSRSRGEGANTIFKRFKKMVKAAVMQEILQKDPCTGITIKVDNNKLTKEVLSPEEVQKMIGTHYEKENPNIHNAFVFCLLTGLRFCDVKELRYSNFDIPNKLLKFDQSKTAGHSSCSSVATPLNDEILSLIGQGDKDELVFPLPSYEMCLKALRHWTKKAGIDKHITWHCARHSFGTNMAAAAAKNGISIRVVQELMGHSSLRYTERYTRVVDQQKREAINDLAGMLTPKGAEL